ncbi:MAG: hypothetical protein LBT00_12380 [Spirochaetaceae bacterium]|jgi:hypothetical protein|nr:hypothetical protein [Spirochaetaceae bacterium]
MTIEQTIGLSTKRRNFLDLPQDSASGKARVEVRVIHATDAPSLSLMDLYGSCEGEDTLDAYFERKRADKALEDNRFSPRLTKMGA